MKINGLPIGNNRLVKVDEAQKSVDTEISKRKTSSVEQGSPVEHDRLEVAGFIVDAEFEPRIERLEAVTQRLTRDGYRDAEVTETIAAKLVEADIASTLAANTETHKIRPDHVEQVDTKVSTEYYETEEVIREIAERIAPVIGLSGLFADSSVDT